MKRYLKLLKRGTALLLATMLVLGLLPAYRYADLEETTPVSLTAKLTVAEDVTSSYTKQVSQTETLSAAEYEALEDKNGWTVASYQNKNNTMDVIDAADWSALEPDSQADYTPCTWQRTVTETVEIDQEAYDALDDTEQAAYTVNSVTTYLYTAHLYKDGDEKTLTEEQVLWSEGGNARQDTESVTATISWNGLTLRTAACGPESEGGASELTAWSLESQGFSFSAENGWTASYSIPQGTMEAEAGFALVAVEGLSLTEDRENKRLTLTMDEGLADGSYPCRVVVLGKDQNTVYDMIEFDAVKDTTAPVLELVSDSFNPVTNADGKVFIHPHWNETESVWDPVQISGEVREAHLTKSNYAAQVAWDENNEGMFTVTAQPVAGELVTIVIPAFCDDYGNPVESTMLEGCALPKNAEGNFVAYIDLRAPEIADFEIVADKQNDPEAPSVYGTPAVISWSVSDDSEIARESAAADAPYRVRYQTADHALTEEELSYGQTAVFNEGIFATEEITVFEGTQLYVYVQAEDLLGNIGTGSVVYSIDNLPPVIETVTIRNTADGEVSTPSEYEGVTYYNIPQTVTLTARDVNLDTEASPVSYLINGETPESPATWQNGDEEAPDAWRVVIPVADGESFSGLTLERAEDTLGNLWTGELVMTPAAFTVDTTGPALTLRGDLDLYRRKNDAEENVWTLNAAEGATVRVEIGWTDASPVLVDLETAGFTAEGDVYYWEGSVSEGKLSFPLEAVRDAAGNTALSVVWKNAETGLKTAASADGSLAVATDDSELAVTVESPDLNVYRNAAFPLNLKVSAAEGLDPAITDLYSEACAVGTVQEQGMFYVYPLNPGMDLEGAYTALVTAVAGTVTRQFPIMILLDTMGPRGSVSLTELTDELGQTVEGVAYYREPVTVTVRAEDVNLNDSVRASVTMTNGTTETVNLTLENGAASFTVADVGEADVLLAGRQVASIQASVSDSLGNSRTLNQESAFTVDTVGISVTITLPEGAPAVGESMKVLGPKASETNPGATEPQSILVQVASATDAGDRKVVVTQRNGDAELDTEFDMNGDSLTIRLVEGEAAVGELSAGTLPVIRVRVIAADLTGRSTEGQADATVETDFLVHYSAPTSGVSFPEGVPATEHYYSPVTLKVNVSVVDPFFDAERTAVKVKVGGTESPVEGLSWTGPNDSGAYETSFTLTDSKSQPAVVGPTVLTDGAPLTEVHVDAYSQSGVHSEITETRWIIVDTDAPDVDFLPLEQLAPSGAGEGPLEVYYPTNMVLMLVVDDVNFNAAATELSAVLGTIGSEGETVLVGKGGTVLWTDEGTRHTARILIFDRMPDESVVSGCYYLITERQSIHSVTAKAHDYAGNEGGCTFNQDGSTEPIVVDNTLPQIVDFTVPAEGCYPADQLITLSVKELNLDQANSLLRLTFDNGTYMDFQDWQAENDVSTLRIAVSDDADTEIENAVLLRLPAKTSIVRADAMIKDLSGHEPDPNGIQNYTLTEFLVDEFAPNVTVTPELLEDHKYGQNLTVVVRVDDVNLAFDAESGEPLVSVEMDGEAITEWEFVNGILSYTFTLTQGTHTGLKVTATDRAGNPTTIERNAEIVIDANGIALDLQLPDGAPTTSTAPLAVIAKQDVDGILKNQTIRAAVTSDTLDPSKDHELRITRKSATGQLLTSSYELKLNGALGNVWEATVILSERTEGDGVLPAGTMPIVGVTVVASDGTGRVLDDTRETNFIVDYSIPSVSFELSEPEAHSAEVADTYYYQENRTLTVTVLEQNLNTDAAESTVAVEINGEEQTVENLQWTQTKNEEGVVTAFVTEIIVTDSKGAKELAEGTAYVCTDGSPLTEIRARVKDLAGNHNGTEGTAQAYSFVVDTTVPDVYIADPVDYDLIQTAGQGGTEAGYHEQAQRITFTVKDANFDPEKGSTVTVNAKLCSFDSDGNKVEGDRDTVELEIPDAMAEMTLWSYDAENGEYSASILVIDASMQGMLAAQETAFYVLVLDGQAVESVHVAAVDLAGRPGEDTLNLDDNIVVDATAPVITAFSVPESGDGETKYHQNGTITVTVEDANFDRTNSMIFVVLGEDETTTLSFNAQVWSWKESNVWTAEITVTDDYDPNNYKAKTTDSFTTVGPDGVGIPVKRVVVQAVDKLGISAVLAQGLTGLGETEYNDAKAYAVDTDFAVDDTPAVVTAFTVPASGAENSTAQYEQAQIVVTVEDANFDAEKSIVTVSLGDGKHTDFKNWQSEDHRSWTATITVDDQYNTEADQPWTDTSIATVNANGAAVPVVAVTVSAADIIGNTTALAEGVEAVEDQTAGSYTVETNFVVDAMNSVITKIEVPEAGENGKTAYGSSGMITVELTEANFDLDESFIWVKLEDNTIAEFHNWTSSDQLHWTASITVNDQYNTDEDRPWTDNSIATVNANGVAVPIVSVTVVAVDLYGHSAVLAEGVEAEEGTLDGKLSYTVNTSFIADATEALITKLEVPGVTEDGKTVYAASGTITVELTEANFDPEKSFVWVKLEDNTIADFHNWTSSDQLHWTASITVNDEYNMEAGQPWTDSSVATVNAAGEAVPIVAVMVVAVDLNNRSASLAEGVSAEQGTMDGKRSYTVTTSFIADNTVPTLGEEALIIPNPDVTDFVYCSETQEIIATVTDPNFDPAASKILVTLRDVTLNGANAALTVTEKSLSFQDEELWTRVDAETAGNSYTWTATITIDDAYDSDPNNYTDRTANTVTTVNANGIGIPVTRVELVARDMVGNENHVSKNTRTIVDTTTGQITELTVPEAGAESAVYCDENRTLTVRVTDANFKPADSILKLTLTDGTTETTRSFYGNAWDTADYRNWTMMVEFRDTAAESDGNSVVLVDGNGHGLRVVGVELFAYDCAERSLELAENFDNVTRVEKEDAISFRVATDFTVDTTTGEISTFSVPGVDGTLYYGTEQQIMVVLKDANFNDSDSKVTVTMGGKTYDFDQWDTSDGVNWGMIITVDNSYNDDKQQPNTGTSISTLNENGVATAITKVEVCALDRAGHPLKLKNQDNIAGTYYADTNFVVDLYPGKITSIVLPAEGEENTKYFDKEQTITVQLSSATFNPDLSMVLVKMGDNDYRASKDWELEENTPNWSLTIQLEDTLNADRVGGAITELKIFAIDKLGRTLTLAPGLEEVHKSLETTTNDNIAIYNLYSNFIVDLTKPVIESIRMPEITDIADTTFFNENQTITVKVRDANFDEDSEVTIQVRNEAIPYRFTFQHLEADEPGVYTATILVTDDYHGNEEIPEGTNVVFTNKEPLIEVHILVNDKTKAKSHEVTNHSTTNFIVDTTPYEVTFTICQETKDGLVGLGNTYQELFDNGIAEKELGFRNKEFTKKYQTILLTISDRFPELQNGEPTASVTVSTDPMYKEGDKLPFEISEKWENVKPEDENDTKLYYQKTIVLKDAKYVDIQVIAEDLAGNVANDLEKSSLPLNFTVDTIAPAINISNPSDYVYSYKGVNYFNKDTRIDVSVSDTNQDSYSISAQVGKETRYVTGTNILVSDTRGDILTTDAPLSTLTVTATDKAGNSSTMSISPNMIVDTTAPEVTASLSGNVQRVFYRMENGERIYYIVPDETINMDNRETEPKDANYSLTVSVTDRNLTVDREANPKFATAYEGGGAGEWSARDKTQTITQTVSVKKNELGQIAFRLHVADLAGNTPEKAVAASLSGGQSDSALVLSFEGGETAIDARIDRRQSGSELGDLNKLPTIELVEGYAPTDTNYGPAGISLYNDELKSFSMTVREGRNSEQNYSSGISHVYWTLNDNLNGSFLQTENNDHKLADVENNVLSNFVTERQFVIPIKCLSENETDQAILTIRITDNTGNVLFEDHPFAYDNLAPRVSVSYDNNDVRNDHYFRANRIATVRVEDMSFRPERTDLYSIATEVGVGEWRTEGIVSETQLSYLNDGDYTLHIDVTDLGQKNTPDNLVNYQGQAPQRFTVDKTAPVIQVSYDQNDVRNGKYYKDPRNATVTITEHNFDQARDLLVQIDATLDSGVKPEPSPFSVGGDTHISNIPFDAEGSFQLRVSYTDLAGNPAQPYEGEEFVVDRTPPQIEISGIQEINAGTAAPIVTFTDKNFDVNGYSVTTGFCRMLETQKQVDLARSVDGTGEGGLTVMYSDIAHKKLNDGIYTLTANATDLAGNQADQKAFRYSVNRFGSTYYTDDPQTQRLADSGFDCKSFPLKINEINPNELEEASISVNLAFNGTITKLEAGADYTMQRTGNAETGFIYSYVLPAELFEESGELREGDYIVTLSSKDKAGNVNTNRSNARAYENGEESTLSLAFMMDKTNPVVSLVGVEPGESIRASSQDVTVYFSDGGQITELSIYLNDDAPVVISGDELAALDGSYTFKLTEQKQEQSLKIVVRDAADNEATLQDVKFFLSSNSMDQVGYWISSNKFYLIGGLAALGGTAGVLIGSKKRKKKQSV